MAVQIPDPGTGNGQTGDNEYVFRKKVRDNFSDQNNAASKTVGKNTGQVPLFTTKGISDTGIGGLVETINETTTEGLIEALYLKGGCVFRTAVPNPITYAYGTGVFTLGGDTFAGYTVSHTGLGIKFFTGLRDYKSNPTIYDLWTSRNATRDSNGFLKAASPIVKVFADKVELNGEAVDQDVSYKKNGVGDYTITTVSGLSTDGWYIELPKDMNGNPKVAVTLSEVDGVISLKSYKRIFSMETFTFEPDLDNPLDIPDTRWIDLRLNEIPVEMPDDMQTEV